MFDQQETDVNAGVSEAEKRGYSRGYAAGVRKKKADRTAHAHRRHEQARFDRFIAAAMTGLLASPRAWSKGDKADSSPEDYARTAANIARAMMDKSP